MSKILVKNKEVVLPGDELAEGLDFLPGRGTLREKDKIIASRLGLVNLDKNVIKIVSLAGRYLPRNEDTVIGLVSDVAYSGWRIELNCAYNGMLNSKDAISDFLPRGADLTKYFKIGDYVVAKIFNVTSQNLVDLSMKGPGLRKLEGGRIIHVNTHKVPRIIGKGGSMVDMIKNATGCRIIVGQNGLVWLTGEPKNEVIAANAIKKIGEKAHMQGLTEKIKKYLSEATGKKIE